MESIDNVVIPEQSIGTPNSSGQGKTSVVPEEIKKWNWGAFGFNWIWGLGNNTYIALLTLIPFVNLVVMIVLGIKGSEWAWQNKKWDSVEHFRNVQKKWAYVWVVFVAIAIFVAVVV